MLAFDSCGSYNVKEILKIEKGVERIVSRSKKQMEKNLQKFRENPNHLSDWLRFTKDGVIITDENKKILYVNPTYERLTEFKAEEVLGKTPEITIKSGQMTNGLYEEMWNEIGNSNSWAGGLINQKKSGELFYSNVSITKVENENTSYFIGIYRDVTDLWMDNQNITHSANHDALTNLLTGIHFQKTVQNILNTKNKDIRMALLFFDLNEFKAINDSLGHLLGNHLLQAFAERLYNMFQESGILGRFGGDEFLVFIPHLKSSEEVIRQINLFNKDLKENPIELEAKTFPISASVGVALSPQDGREVNELIRKADIAMYHAKKKNESLVEFYMENYS